MIARAPGKLVLSGAYAVLEGAPAIVMAVDRFAVADLARSAQLVTAEARYALGERAPHCDVSALAHQGLKLGLGSSAAALVASLGAVALSSGASLTSEATRARIFADARAAHAAVQSGGSGVDVAAATYGGVLRYALDASGRASMRAATLPAGLVWRAFFSGASARTSDLRARVDASRATRPAEHRAVMRTLATASEACANALEAGDVAASVSALAAFAESLAQLGDLADAPIVSSAVRTLGARAASEGACFFPSGAGGGDVALYCGVRAPSADFVRTATSLSMLELPIQLTFEGVSQIGDDVSLQSS